MRDRGEWLHACESTDAAWTAQRRVRHQCDPGIRTALDDPAAKRGVVEDAECDLHDRDRGELEGLVQLRAIDVADTDTRDEPVVDELRERSHGRPPRRSRIGRVEEVERRSAGRRAPRGSPRSRRGSSVLVPSGTHAPPGRVMPPFVTMRAVARIGAPQRAGEELLVVSVRTRRVEHGDPRLRSGDDRRERAFLVAIGVGREAHAAEADAQLAWVEPAQSGAARLRGRTPRGGRPRPRARAAPREAAVRTARVARGCLRTTTVPATKPSTRNVAVTSPPWITAARCSSAITRRRSSWLSTRLSKRGSRRAGAAASPRGRGARGRSSSSRPDSSRKRRSGSRAAIADSRSRTRTPLQRAMSARVAGPKAAR